MNKQHTYREFLALLPSRRYHSDQKQKYANRLTNYESYYRSPIKLWTYKYSVILQYPSFDDNDDDDYVDDDYDDGDESGASNSQPRKMQKLT